MCGFRGRVFPVMLTAPELRKERVGLHNFPLRNGRGRSRNLASSEWEVGGDSVSC